MARLKYTVTGAAGETLAPTPGSHPSTAVGATPAADPLAAAAPCPSSGRRRRMMSAGERPIAYLRDPPSPFPAIPASVTVAWVRYLYNAAIRKSSHPKCAFQIR
jgi:hypothetical protein